MDDDEPERDEETELFILKLLVENLPREDETSENEIPSDIDWPDALMAFSILLGVVRITLFGLPN